MEISQRHLQGSARYDRDIFKGSGGGQYQVMAIVFVFFIIFIQPHQDDSRKDEVRVRIHLEDLTVLAFTLLSIRVLGLDVRSVAGGLDCSVGTVGTFVGFHPSVSPHVSPQRVVISCLIVALLTAEWLLSCMLSHVELQHGFPGRFVIANITDVRL